MNHSNDLEKFDWENLKGYEFEYKEGAWQDMENRINATESPFNFLQNIQTFLGLATVFYFLVIVALVYQVVQKTNHLSTNQSFSQEINSALWLPFLESNTPQASNSTYLWNLTASNTYFGEDLPVLVAGDAKVNAPIFVPNLTQRLDDYAAFTNPDKVYLQTDRTLYHPGDDVWFKAYVRDASTLCASNMSDMLYVELIDTEGEIVHKRKLIALGGHAKGDFYINESLADGIYTIKAYTNWQRNFKDYFSKEIIVKTIDESDKKTKTPRAKKDENISLQFFPEGGELIADMPARVAFKALYESGQSADVEGIIVDSNDEKVLAFQSYHKGMGLLEFTPKFGETYTAKITRPKNKEQTYRLPPANGTGFALKINLQKTASLDVSVIATQKTKLTLLVQSRGKICLEKKINVKPGINPVTISTAKFPIGIAQITLLKQDETELAERLVFMNQHKQLDVEISTDKEQYEPRETVEMTVKVKDENGKPVQGNFSLAVVDNSQEYTDNEQSNVLAYTLLTSDIKGNIEDPNFYFEKDNPKADQALDLLLMTQGWRKFEWEKINIAPNIAVEYSNEKAGLAGVLIDENSQPVIDALIRVSGTSQRQRTDKSGYFDFENVDISNGTYLQIQAEGYPENWAKIRECSSQLAFRISKDAATARDLSYYENIGKGVRIQYVPPIYDTIVEKYEVQPPTSQMIAIEPVFEKLMDSTLVKPAENGEMAEYQLFIRDTLMSAAGYEEIEIPAEYVTNTRIVLKSPATTREVVVPALYATRVRRVVKTPASTRQLKDGINQTTPATYETITETYDVGLPNISEKDYLKLGQGIARKKSGGKRLFPNLDFSQFSATGVSVKNIEQAENTGLENYIMYYLKEIEAAQAEEVKIPSQYITQEKRVLVEAPKAEKIQVSAEFIEVEKWVKNEAGDYEIEVEKIEVVPAHFVYAVRPARLDTIQEQVKISSPVEQVEFTPAKYEIRSKTISKPTTEDLVMNGFYRARSFYVPKYDKPTPDDSKDFRPTIYWKTNVDIGKNGTTTFTFYNSDAKTTFHTVLEGFSENGGVGYARHEHTTE